MLTYCFTFLDGIGKKTIDSFSLIGIRTWGDFLNTKDIKGISKKRKAYYNRELEKAKHALHKKNIIYFATILQPRETWRLYPHFKEKCCFLDIEIDSRGKIIVLTVFNRFESKTFVSPIHFDHKKIQDEFEKYDVIITYNGRSFDVPKIEQQCGFKVEGAHIDLKSVCQQLGLSGGLKEIEKELGIFRPPHLKGKPVDLWKAYHASGDPEWLKLLVSYNEEDAINLFQLMEKCLVLFKEKEGK